MSDNELVSLEESLRERDLKAEKADGVILPTSISDVIWKSFYTTTEADLHFSDGTPAIRLGYRRATMLGYKSNGVKKAHATFAAIYTILVPGLYWHLNPTIRLERSDNSFLVILGGREVTGRIDGASVRLLYGASTIRDLGDEGPLYDVIREFAQFSDSWKFWANSSRLPQGDL
jgi:hypothetical protein